MRRAGRSSRIPADMTDGTAEYFWKSSLAGMKRLRKKGKGCDIGYALATNSCEGANSVETCTVTALDAITAFAVPNPNFSSQSRRFFQVWLLVELPRRADHSAYFGLAKFYLSQPFQPSTGATLESYSKIVNALFWCNWRCATCQNSKMQPIESLTFNERLVKLFPIFAQNHAQATEPAKNGEPRKSENQANSLTRGNVSRMMGNRLLVNVRSRGLRRWRLAGKPGLVRYWSRDRRVRGRPHQNRALDWTAG